MQFEAITSCPITSAFRRPTFRQEPKNNSAASFCNDSLDSWSLLASPDSSHTPCPHPTAISASLILAYLNWFVFVPRLSQYSRCRFTSAKSTDWRLCTFPGFANFIFVLTWTFLCSYCRYQHKLCLAALYLLCPSPRLELFTSQL